MRAILSILFFFFLPSLIFSQLCRDTIKYGFLSESFEDKQMREPVVTVLNDQFRVTPKEELLVFYNTDNEIFKFHFNDKGLYKGYYILWLYEMLNADKKGNGEWGPLRNYSVELSEKELNKIRDQDFSELLKLADTTVYRRSFETFYVNGTPVKFHYGQFGVRYRSKTCDIEYLEKDTTLTAFNDVLKKRLKTETKKKKILTNLEFNYYSLGGCTYSKR